MSTFDRGQKAQPKARVRAGMGRKVAVIEDDTSTTALLLTLLQIEGFVAESFDNTAEVGAQISAAGSDFVLCDDNMPGMRGAQIIEIIRATPELDKVRVVLMSGMYMEEPEWRKMKADGFLLKPFTRQELLESLLKVVGRTHE